MSSQSVEDPAKGGAASSGTAVFKGIILEIKAEAAYLTINRPPLNILDMETLKEFDKALTSIEKQPEIHILIIRGAGEKAFSAGADIKEHLPENAPQMLKIFHNVILHLRNLPLTTIASVHGLALGGGCELASACDILVASDNAQFGQPEIGVGCFPPVAVSLLPRIIGEKRAYELLVLGRRWSADEAFKFGLVNKVVPCTELEKVTKEYCDQIIDKSKIIVSYTKEAMNFPPDFNFEKALERAEDIYVNKLLKTHDGKEGIDAYLQKRKPTWKGC